MMSKSDSKVILNFIAEAGMLKRVARSGWWVLGIKDSESVADHSFRCAVLAFILSRMEKVSSDSAVIMSLFGDIHEARINDMHKMAQRYVDFDRAEIQAFDEQINFLPKEIKKELNALHKEYRAQKTKASIIARDADILECLIQAKEYQEHGFKEAGKFMKKAPEFLRTKSAQALWRSAQAMSLNKWWENIGQFRR